MNRHFIQNRSLFLIASVVGIAVLFGRFQRVRADDFRVESKVYEDKATKPSSESLTLFVFNGDGAKYHNLVYDFLASPREITVLDYSGEHRSHKDANGAEVATVSELIRISLLDPLRKVRTELTDHQLETFSEQLRSRAARQTSPLVKFAAQPKFEESDEERDGSLWMKFASRWMTYRVRLAKVDESVDFGQPYYSFCDYSARLNSMLHPGALPPFPRLAVDRHLTDGFGPPAQIELVISDDPTGGKPVVLHSEHHFSTQLTAADRQRIDEASEQLKSFKQISWEEYLRPIQQAKR